MTTNAAHPYFELPEMAKELTRADHTYNSFS